VPSAVAVDPTLPARIDDVFRRALAKDPADRPASARELVGELRAALAQDEAPAPTLVLPGVPKRVVHTTRRRPSAALAAITATLVLAGGFVAAALVASRDGGSPQASREPQSRGTTSTVVETTTTETTTTDDAVDGVALNVEGFELMQAGEYAEALPLLRAAVIDLNGSGLIDEAYASYNLAFSRFATGRCDGVVALLDRSERIQGERDEIDDLRQEWRERCASSSGEGDGEGDD
jgi:hypothetical protein